MDCESDELIILLYIAKGVGFEFKGDNIVLTASLGGTKLETEPIASGFSTPFNNNLIWETDKNSLKRMKTESLPIKLECFESNIIYGQEVRKFIGYILLPIRGVPIVSTKKPLVNKTHWYKLIGLNPEWKPKKPEISLHLSITDKCGHEKMMLSIKPNSVERSEIFEIEPKRTAEMLVSQQGIHIQLLQNEGLLQVGDMVSDCDIFIAKLMFRNAKNIEQIVNPAEQMNRLFQFHYNLLGTPTHCALTPKGSGTFSIQEQIAIHFRTSLNSLKEYFIKVLYIPIALFYNETIVGNARFNFSGIFDIEGLKEFANSFGTENNTFTHESTFSIETLFDLPPNAPKPFVEYVFSLKYLSTTKVSSCEIIMDKPQIAVAEYIDSQAGGDKSSLSQFELPPTLNDLAIANNLELRDVQSDSMILSNRQSEKQQQEYNNNAKYSSMTKISKSTPAVTAAMKSQNYNHDKTNLEKLLIQKCPLKTTKDISRTFSFNLILQTVKFNRRPEIGIFQISLHHQKADTSYTIANAELTEISSNLIEFKNLELQLFFLSTTDNILELVGSESCTLKINGPRGLCASAEIDNEMLLLSTKEKRSGVILMENQANEKVAMAHIFVYLDDVGINLNSQIKKHLYFQSQKPSEKDGVSLSVPYMDDIIAYKIVEELEEWKQKQQDIFLVELKRKEINFMALLSAEWQKKKSEQETRLSTKLDECTKLTNTLEEANRQLKEKGLERIGQDRAIECAKNEVEKSYSVKIFELNEKCRRIEDDMTHKLQWEAIRYRELEFAKEIVENENKRLENELIELTEQYNEMKKSFLPKEQLAGLFQDVRTLSQRLEEVQKSKIFYKEQWAKIIREVHKIKSENLQKLETRLRNCRAYNLGGILKAEQNVINIERGELNGVKNALGSDFMFATEENNDDDSNESFYEFER